MKTSGELFEAICSLENLYRAARKARRLKSRKIYVEDFELRRESVVSRLREELLDGSYRPGGYRHFHVYDPKKRLISAAPYRDRVVHHALCNVIGPILERRFVYDSYSCRVGKGTLAARERCRFYTNRHAFVLKCDARKFFQSIDHEILLAKLARLISCERTLELCRRIVGSFQDREVPPAYFPGDDLFEPFARARGLPIGNLTSQLWANLYLDRLDHVIKEVLRAPGYARYTDDWLVWADDKSLLQEWRGVIEAELGKERLQFHPKKTQIMRTHDGVSFLGFRFLPGLAPRVLGATKRRFERRTRQQARRRREGRLDAAAMGESVFGWTQFSRYGNVVGLLRTYEQDGFSAARGHGGCGVLRGGSWNNNNPGNLECANRNNNHPSNRNNNNGFRVVLLR